MKLSVKPITIRLSKPFVSYKGIVTAVTQVLVQISDESHQGYGIAIPAREYSTTVDNLTAECLSVATILKKFNNPFELQCILSQCMFLHPAALSAIDMALHDLLGKALNLPLHRYFGLLGFPIPYCSTSLGLMSPQETIHELNQYQQRPILKIKMSAPDEERLQLIRQHYQGRLWIDANGAWSIEQALQAVQCFQAYNIELIEQPIAKGQYKKLQQIQDSTNILIIADEDCMNLSDVVKLQGVVSGINVKLLKSGGLNEAKKIIEVAKTFDMKIMLGCKIESVLGVTAMSHLAGLADFLDLDGHLNNLFDPFSGIQIDHGNMLFSELSGIGCQLI